MVCKPPGAPLPSVLTGLGGRRPKRVMRERKLTLARADMSVPHSRHAGIVEVFGESHAFTAQ